MSSCLEADVTFNGVDVRLILHFLKRTKCGGMIRGVESPTIIESKHTLARKERSWATRALISERTFGIDGVLEQNSWKFVGGTTYPAFFFSKVDVATHCLYYCSCQLLRQFVSAYQYVIVCRLRGVSGSG